MRLIKASEYNHHTMQLAVPIFDSMRRVLLAAGNTIHPKYLQKLNQLGISHLIVEDAESKGITLDEMIDMPTWTGATKAVQDAFDQIRNKKPLELQPVQKIVGQLINEVKRRKAILLIPSSANTEELRSHAHAVNVTLLALQIGKLLGYHDLQLRDLAIGCIFHDVGKILAAKEQEHPEVGFQILREVKEISSMSCHVAYQHHEKFDGSGYPRGLAGKAIIEYAQVCGLANFYEDLLSIDKVAPYEALELVMALNERGFKESIVRAFVNGVPSYPPGTKVQLQGGEKAIVIRIASHMQRPVVRIISTDEEIDLAENPTIFLKQVEETVELS